MAAVVSLVLVYSAYVAEVYRAGIDSVHRSQSDGARSLGLSQGQSMRYVVLPQAIRRVIPPLLNDFIGLQKDTALIGLLGLVEVARAAEQYASSTFNFTGYTMAALLFVAGCGGRKRRGGRRLNNSPEAAERVARLSLLPKIFFDVLFFFHQVPEYILRESQGVLLGQVDPPVLQHGLKLLDRTLGHPDHHLRLP